MTCITLKLRLYPTDAQITAFDETMEQYRQATNFVSQYYFDQHFKPSQAELNKVLYHQLREKFRLKSQMAQSVLKTVLARYKTVKTQLKQKPYHYHDIHTDTWYTEKRDLEWLRKPIQFKRPQVDLVSARDWSLTKGQLSINTIAARQVMPFNHKGFDQYWHRGQFGTAKLVKLNHCYFLHVSCTLETSEFDKEQLKHVVGIDRGLRFLTTAYDEQDRTHFVSGQAVCARREHFKQVRKELQQRGTKSARKRLKAIGHRETRWMTDVNHQLSKTLVNQYGTGTVFALEDLTNVRFATEKSAKDSRYTMVSWAFYQLEQFLKYKAELTGSTVISVSAQYTSQRCPKCGLINKANRDHEHHEYRCAACGYRSNDDRVGAMNIQELGKRWITGEPTRFN